MTADELRAVCDEVMSAPDLSPATSGGHLVTHCSEGLARIAEACGCGELTGLTANEQCEAMAGNHSGRWKRVAGNAATFHAQAGGLAVAAMSGERLGEEHGHVAVVYPAPMEYSGSLARLVPMVANVGKQDREERASQAFPPAIGEPDYFIWR